MVDMPNVKNALIDKERNITYIIMAYRPLTYEEKVAFIRVSLQDKNVRKQAKPGKTVKLISTFR